MAATAKVVFNTKELDQMKSQIIAAAGQDAVEDFIKSCSKELAARLLAKVIKRTPTHDYKMDQEVHFVTKDGRTVQFHANIGKNGGTLKRGWTAKTHQEAEQGKSAPARTWANSLPVTKASGVYTINVINPVEYASYVELGHRTRGGKGWVEGQFFLTISENELRTTSSAILQAKLNKYLKGMVK